MGRTTALRITFDLFVFGALFLLPWWASLSAAIVAVMIVPRFYEILLVGMFFDLLYAGGPTDIPESFIFTIACFIIFSVATFLRQRLSLDDGFTN